MPATLKLKDRKHFNGRACAICHANRATTISQYPEPGWNGPVWYDLFWSKPASNDYVRPKESLRLIASFCVKCRQAALDTLDSDDVGSVDSVELAQVLLTMFRLKQQTRVTAKDNQT